MRLTILTSAFLALAGVLTALPGCTRDELPPDDAKQEIDPQIATVGIVAHGVAEQRGGSERRVQRRLHQG